MNNKFGQIKIQFPVNYTENQKPPFYIISVGSMENQHPCYRPNGLDGYQFLYCSSGCGYLVIDGHEHIISEGMGFYLRPEVEHEYYAKTEPWTTHWILFHGKGVDLIPAIEELGTYNIFYVSSLNKMNQLHEKVYTSAEISNFSNMNKLSVDFYQFLLEIKNCISTTQNTVRETQLKKLTDVISYMNQHYQEDIPLEDLAQIARVTPQHLCRLFKDAYSMRPMEYLNNYRLTHAKRLLIQNTELTLKEVAELTGFHDISYFCSCFKKNEGMTALEFKRLHCRNSRGC